ncbi:MAG: type VI secretion system baseplate subunit TssG [Blastocatellia bacterium]|nr:type VI secretion system baseplate subunit TssG [Blastocatellia bacterium]
MGTPRRKQNPPVAAQLAATPYEFSFFQAVRLLERLHPERVPLGRDADPAGEVVHCSAHLSLGFPASEIHDLTFPTTPEDDSGPALPPEMVVAFMGLAGPAGTLPAAYTEELINRTRQEDPAFAAFLDLFNHRLVSLFYRAWEKYHLTIGFERNQADPFTDAMHHLIGMGMQETRGRLPIPDQALVYYSGLICQAPHSATAIAAILTDYFGIPVEVEPFVGRWIHLEGDDCTQLGEAASDLGFSMMSGSRVWDTQSKFRLRLGPLTYEQFRSFLPSGTAREPLLEFTKFLVGLEFDFDSQLVLQAAEVPDFTLSSKAEAPALGWTTWLKSKPFETDDEQVILN